MEGKLERLRLHFFYCSVILTLVIIAIATDRWSLQPKFTEFLSNAATMTSLVLGLVAIFYSFISNDALSKSLGSIATVSDEVRQSREQMTRQVALTESTIAASEKSADVMKKASSEVSTNLETLSQTLSAIRTHTEALHGSLGNLPTRLDQLESKVIDATRSLGEKTQVAPAPSVVATIDPALAKSFLNTSSLACNLLTYACALAVRSGKELVLADFCVAIDSKLENYMSGFLACMDAAQLVDRSAIEGKTRVYKIESLHPVLLTTTKDYLTSFLDRHFKTPKPEIYTRWTTAVEKIEKLFE